MDKVAVVTGGASGIGRAVALLFAREGAKVIIADVNEDRARSVVREIEREAGKAIAIKIDVSKVPEVRSMIKCVLDTYGAINLLHCSAGVLVPGSIEDVALGDWNRVLDVNLTGSFLCARFAIPEIRRAGGGAITFTSSTAGLRGSKDLAAYSASKGALVALTKQMAVEYASANIRVNCLCPGWINTPFNDPYINSGELSDEVISAGIPAGRQGTSDEAAQAALFLASDASSYITGHVLFVDGGISARE